MFYSKWWRPSVCRLRGQIHEWSSRTRLCLAKIFHMTQLDLMIIICWACSCKRNELWTFFGITPAENPSSWQLHAGHVTATPMSTFKRLFKALPVWPVPIQVSVTGHWSQPLGLTCSTSSSWPGRSITSSVRLPTSCRGQRAVTHGTPTVVERNTYPATSRSTTTTQTWRHAATSRHQWENSGSESDVYCLRAAKNGMQFGPT